MPRPFRVAIELRCDDITARIRAKFETKEFKDAAGQARACSKFLEFWDTGSKTKSGYLSFDQYWEAMTGLCFVGIKADLVAFFSFWDTDMAGVFHYKRNANIIFGLDPSFPPLMPETKVCLERLRVVILTKYSAAGFHLLQEALSRHRDARSSIDRVALEECLESLVGLAKEAEGEVLPPAAFSAAHLRTVCNDLDPNHTGRIVYEQLDHALLCHALTQDRKTQVRDIFFRFDSTDSGTVSRQHMFRAADFSCHPAVAAGVISQMQAEDTFAALPAQLSLVDLLHYYKGISISLEDDTAFEMLLRNTWAAAVETPFSNPTLRRVLVSHTDGTQEIVDIVDDIDGSRFDVHSAREKVRSRGVDNIAKLEL